MLPPRLVPEAYASSSHPCLGTEAGRCSRPKVRTTVQDPSATPFADLVERDFARGGLDELWLGDLTYVATDEG